MEIMFWITWAVFLICAGSVNFFKIHVETHPRLANVLMWGMMGCAMLSGIGFYYTFMKPIVNPVP